MRLRQSEPGGLATAPALKAVTRPESYRAPGRSQPRCELYGVNLVDAFPRRCPMATPNPLTTIGDLQDTAYRELGRGHCDDADQGGAVELLNQLDTCGSCLDVNLRHRTVRRLRRELGVGR